MNLARWIGQLRAQAGDHVVEIGPGLGALTELLVREDILLTLIEKDQRMVEWLGERFASSRVELFHIDALDFDLRSTVQERSRLLATCHAMQRRP